MRAEGRGPGMRTRMTFIFNAFGKFTIWIGFNFCVCRGKILKYVRKGAGEFFKFFRKSASSPGDYRTNYLISQYKNLIALPINFSLLFDPLSTNPTKCSNTRCLIQLMHSDSTHLKINLQTQKKIVKRVRNRKRHM